MIRRLKFRAFVLLLITLFSVALLLAQSLPPSLGPAGTTWGGEHARMLVTETGATLEFDCARGNINQSVQVQAVASFTAKGTLTRERGGPVRKDDADEAVPATYSGTISGDELKLRIASGPQGAAGGEYLLTRGNTGHLVKCR